MRNMMLLCWLLIAPCFAQVETLSVDGIFLNSKSTTHAWLPSPCPDGQYRAGKTTVEVTKGRVTKVWGEHLSMGHHTMAQVGWKASELEQTLGKCEKILYGCGSKQSSKICFYDQLGVTITASESITQVHLRPVGE